MSRKQPKKHRLFLNWLKGNRCRFPVQPMIHHISTSSLKVDITGTHSVFRCHLEYTVSGGPWLSVSPKGSQDELAIFYGAETKTSHGWTSLALRPEDIRYWATRQELWVALCFEQFLQWCYQNSNKPE